MWAEGFIGYMATVTAYVVAAGYKQGLRAPTEAAKNFKVLYGDFKST